jgi:hypothetical protein
MRPLPASLSQRRLLRGVSHVKRYWFALNPDVLRQLEKARRSSLRSAEPEAFIKILQQDCALWTYVMMRLICQSRDKNLAPSISNDPLALVAWAGSESIHLNIADAVSFMGTHSLTSATPDQASRLRKTVIIASTVAFLSEVKVLNPTAGFSHSVLREAGLNLMAWNYPTVYGLVIANNPDDASLANELTKVVGFSPDELSQALVERAYPVNGLSSVIPPSSTLGTYDKFHQVGRLLARVSDTDRGHSSRHDWEEVNSYLWNMAGSKWEVGIRDVFQRVSQSYATILPSYFGELRSFTPKSKFSKRRDISPHLKNRYLQHCQPPVQEALQACYANMPGGLKIRSLLKILIREVIPQAGFTGGCVFVVNSEKQQLTPKTLIGSVRRRSLAAVNISAVQFSAASESESEAVCEVLQRDGEGADSVVGAFASKNLIVTREEAGAKGGVTTFAYSLGSRCPLGVLYLERPSGQQHHEDSFVVPTFQAIAQTLCDVFLIE